MDQATGPERNRTSRNTVDQLAVALLRQELHRLTRARTGLAVQHNLARLVRGQPLVALHKTVQRQVDGTFDMA